MGLVAMKMARNSTYVPSAITQPSIGNGVLVELLMLAVLSDEVRATSAIQAIMEIQVRNELVIRVAQLLSLFSCIAAQTLERGTPA